MLSSQNTNNQIDLDQSATIDASNKGMNKTTMKTRPKVASTVQFAGRVQCRKILSRRAYTNNEARRTWLLADEVAKMNQKRFVTVDRMEAGKRPRQNSSFRGLETLSLPGAERLAQTVDVCVGAVLAEQGRQRKDKSISRDRLARVSKKTSKESKVLAYKRAKADKREAEKAYTSSDASIDMNASMSSAETFQPPKRSCLKNQTGEIVVASSMLQNEGMNVPTVHVLSA